MFFVTFTRVFTQTFFMSFLSGYIYQTRNVGNSSWPGLVLISQCFFHFFSFSGSGGAILSTISGLCYEFSDNTFFDCSCSTNGGAFCLENGGSFSCSRSCFNKCKCSFGQAFCINQQSNGCACNIQKITVVLCSPDLAGPRYHTLDIRNAQCIVQEYNSSSNILYNWGTAVVFYTSYINVTHCHFADSVGADVLGFVSTPGVTNVISTCNFLNNTRGPSDFAGTIDSYIAITIDGCIFIQNLHKCVFYQNTGGSFNVKNCVMDSISGSNYVTSNVIIGLGIPINVQCFSTHLCQILINTQLHHTYISRIIFLVSQAIIHSY